MKDKLLVDSTWLVRQLGFPEHMHDQALLTLLTNNSERDICLPSLSAKLVEGLGEAFTLACHEVDSICGGCPNTKYGWNHPDGCIQICALETAVAECWEMYFIDLATKEEK